MSEKPVFEVIFEAKGRSVGKLRNEVTVTANSPFKTTNMLATDEGKFQGGDDTAPTPLEYFLTALVGCLMTQIRVFSKRLKIPIHDVTVDCTAHWHAVKDDVAPYKGKPLEFSIEVDIVSDEPQERIDELVLAARRGCFVEQTLMQANDIKHSIKLSSGPTPA